MARIPRFYAGPYGDGTFGLKTSRSGFDVKVLADDSDVMKRSFNSQWAGLCKIKILGSASAVWTQYQLAIPFQQFNSGGITYSFNTSRSGWRSTDPVLVPTGLNYIPIWESRILDRTNKLVYDDYVYVTSTSSTPQSSSSGGRSYHSGPSTSPANTLFFLPARSTPQTSDVYNDNNSATWRTFADPPQPQPPYPAYPPMPTIETPALAYLIYGNKLGDNT